MGTERSGCTGSVRDGNADDLLVTAKRRDVSVLASPTTSMAPDGSELIDTFGRLRVRRRGQTRRNGRTASGHVALLAVIHRLVSDSKTVAMAPMAEAGRHTGPITLSAVRGHLRTHRSHQCNRLRTVRPRDARGACVRPQLGLVPRPVRPVRRVVLKSNGFRHGNDSIPIGGFGVGGRMQTTVTDLLKSIRRPEYTGENRCLPCTTVNALIAVALAGLISVLRTR